MYFTDAKKAHYEAGVPRDTKAFYENLQGLLCPDCNNHAGFSTLNEPSTREEGSSLNPFRCAGCLHQWSYE